MKKLFWALFVIILTSLSFSAFSQGSDSSSLSPEAEYWRFQFFLRVNTATFKRKVETYVPRTLPNQDILSLRRYAPEFSYHEEYQGPNLKGYWETLPDNFQANWIIYDLSARTTEQKKPKKLVQSTEVPTDDTPLTLAPDLEKLLDEKLAQLALKDKSIHKKTRILFDYIRNSFELDEKGQKPDLRRIFEANKASIAEKNHLFRTFLSRLSVPTRLVNGVLLKDRKVKEKYHQWVQAYFNNSWINFDLGDGYFATLPADHFAIFFGEDAALKVTQGVEYKYHFVINKLSEENALDPDDLVIPQKDLFDENYFKNTDGKESFIKNAIGRIAIITETPIKDSIIEKISNQAAQSHTKIYFYSAPYESHFFRGTYIAKILSQNFETLQETDAIFIQSEDDAGLYALFRMARNNKKMKKTTIFLNGNFSKPVGDILGYALYKLIKPKDLFITQEEMTVERAWDLLQDHVLDGLPIQEVSQRWNIPFQDLSQKKMVYMTGWRQFLIKTWILAAKAEVNLESIYLILILPIIALVIVVFRNIIGLETFGTFTPVLVSVAFLTTGVFWGVMIFAIIVATGVLFRVLFRRIHIHLVARMAMLIAVVGLTMLVIIIIGVHFGWGALINVSILPMVIMAGIVENFTRTQMELGTREALRLTVYTLMVSVISYFIIDVAGIQSLVLVFPEVTLIAILLEILIGRWNGIRLFEYMRFYKIIGPQQMIQAKEHPAKT